MQQSCNSREQASQLKERVYILIKYKNPTPTCNNNRQISAMVTESCKQIQVEGCMALQIWCETGSKYPGVLNLALPSVPIL